MPAAKYLELKAGIEGLKRKLRIPLVDASVKRFRYAIPPQPDDSLQEYVDTLAAKDEKLNVETPFAELLYTQQEEMLRLVNDYKKTSAEQNDRITALEKAAKHQKIENEKTSAEQNDKITALEKAAKHQKTVNAPLLQWAFNLGAGNFLLDLTMALARDLGDERAVREMSGQHFTNAAKQYFGSINEQKLKRSKLEKYYYKIFTRSWDEIIHNRNDAAHVSKGEFASYLLYPDAEPQLEHYRKLWEYVYNESVEGSVARYSGERNGRIFGEE